jgi:hypothetical protein
MPIWLYIDVMDFVYPILLGLLWFAVIRWILPRAGVPT